ncbi:MAG: bifunctional nuclease family protein [Paludibacteraceae bacterium]|nr:bifunctional nuclease family protein [Paludibacteraceae bacterium]
MEKEIQLNIIGLVYNQTVVGTYGLVLSEIDGSRRFSVMIGEPEAQSIALKINNKKSPRPLTHDLIHSILGVFGANLEKVVIYNMVNDVFYSELHIRTADSVQIIDARTSDAVALAVRSDSPVFIRASILDVVGSFIEREAEKEDSDDEINVDAESLTPAELDALSEEDLQQLLEMALKEEKYELAVSIRDALKRKENK